MHKNASYAIKKYIIGNWKSNKTKKEVVVFFNLLAKLLKSSKKSLSSTIVPIICPSFVHLETARELVQKLKIPIYLGAQDISPFESGAYTGEVYGDQLKDYVSYAIIGHSERRKHFSEIDTLLVLKSQQAKKWGIKSIYCIPDVVTVIPEDVALIAYEPIFAIGTGKPDLPENANNVIKKIKNKFNNIPVIYGGSVSSENIKEFLKMDAIDGVLPGKASLDPVSFYRMLINAAS